MTKIPNIADIITTHANQDKTLYESAADLGAMILEMEHEEELRAIRRVEACEGLAGESRHEDAGWERRRG